MTGMIRNIPPSIIKENEHEIYKNTSGVIEMINTTLASMKTVNNP
jgi:hypothetical protein